MPTDDPFDSLRATVARRDDEIAALRAELAGAITRCQKLNGIEAQIEDALENAVPEWSNSDDSAPPATIADGVMFIARKLKEAKRDTVCLDWIAANCNVEVVVGDRPRRWLTWEVRGLRLTIEAAMKEDAHD